MLLLLAVASLGQAYADNITYVWGVSACVCVCVCVCVCASSRSRKPVVNNSLTSAPTPYPSSRDNSPPAGPDAPPPAAPNAPYPALWGSPVDGECVRQVGRSRRGWASSWPSAPKQGILLEIFDIYLLTSFNGWYVHQGCWSWGGDVARTVGSMTRSTV